MSVIFDDVYFMGFVCSWARFVVKDAPGQFRGDKGPAYIAGTNAEAVTKAIEVTKNTTIGVMDNQGNVVKSSTRKK